MVKIQIPADKQNKFDERLRLGDKRLIKTLDPINILAQK